MENIELDGDLQYAVAFCGLRAESKTIGRKTEFGIELCQECEEAWSQVRTVRLM